MSLSDIYFFCFFFCSFFYSFGNGHFEQTYTSENNLDVIKLCINVLFYLHHLYFFYGLWKTINVEINVYSNNLKQCQQKLLVLVNNWRIYKDDIKNSVSEFDWWKCMKKWSEINNMFVDIGITSKNIEVRLASTGIKE